MPINTVIFLFIVIFFSLYVPQTTFVSKNVSEYPKTLKFFFVGHNTRKIIHAALHLLYFSTRCKPISDFNRSPRKLRCACVVLCVYIFTSAVSSFTTALVTHRPAHSSLTSRPERVWRLSLFKRTLTINSLFFLRYVGFPTPRIVIKKLRYDLFHVWNLVVSVPRTRPPTTSNRTAKSGKT